MDALTKDTASEFDFMLLLDGSGSMSNQSAKFEGKTRWEEAQESVTSFARALAQFDVDGIDVVQFGGKMATYEGVTADKVAEIFANNTPRGTTPLNDALNIVINKQKTTGKKTFAVVLTDGEPDSPAMVANTITNASNDLNSDEELTFLFIQVGDDASARAYLDKLDDQLSGKFDIVDVVSATEADQFEPLELINKAIAG
jgi:Mg-chelatase subunit ChlD